MIAVVDFGRGNLFSIGQSLRHVGQTFVMSSDPAEIANAHAIIFPGVGAFGDAASELRARGLDQALRDAAAAGTPILGICVGCQLLLTKGEEFGEHDGLGVICGSVRRLPEPRSDDPGAIRIPNVGWWPIDVRRDDPLLGVLGPDDMMYFVHSYCPFVDDDREAIGWIMVNGQRVPVAVRHDNVVGVQFHPEKSGPSGLAFFARFLALAQS